MASSQMVLYKFWHASWALPLSGQPDNTEAWNGVAAKKLKLSYHVPRTLSLSLYIHMYIAIMVTYFFLKQQPRKLIAMCDVPWCRILRAQLLGPSSPVIHIVASWVLRSRDTETVSNYVGNWAAMGGFLGYPSSITQNTSRQFNLV